MKFSLLMSIYNKEKPEFFERAMRSVWNEQTVKPDEIVLVKDGPLNDQLETVINRWKVILSDVLIIVGLPENIGLGGALNIGIDRCSNELIARMDTDDISYSDRFEKQLAVFEHMNVDICSGNVSEFDQDEHKIIFYRNIPESHDEIFKYFKVRSAVNHPAVMFKKTAVLNAGSYQTMIWFEDYYLWVRMLLNGSIFFNIQEPLVNMRAGYGQLVRRSGLRYAVAEYRFMKELKNIGFLNFFEFARNVAIRFVARTMHKSILKRIYRNLREPSYLQVVLFVVISL
ncbi:glycosyltransferase [Seleniivibrio sp.]|uniref:glycosyltransferase n=1 Tax=Seleniivibrio sp. TaxID=2898801 RepID=UPI0025EF1E42|nr:glycosyltransferase [Seleniivibrio sp.]MCD8554964.1 glycosyltransferase [Seleniivibrio sp.]